MKNRFVKEQFNKQAERFSQWSVTQDEKYMQGFLDFTRPSANNEMLDLACGPGFFPIFCGKKLKKVVGVDISDKEIEIAKANVASENLANVSFICADVENIPVEDNSFSFVTCKHSFHHFQNPENVFKEMMRCCKSGGKICIEDLTTYESEKVNDFFLEFDIYVDPSHLKTFSGDFFSKLYEKNNIDIWRKYYLIEDLKIWDYVGHGVHSEKIRKKIEDLIEQGLKDPEISKHIFYKGNDLYFKRPLYIIAGTKK